MHICRFQIHQIYVFGFRYIKFVCVGKYMKYVRKHIHFVCVGKYIKHVSKYIHFVCVGKYIKCVGKYIHYVCVGYRCVSCLTHCHLTTLMGELGSRDGT